MTIKQALLESIEKWWRIAQEGIVNRGCRDCALCMHFGYAHGYRPDCKRCPIGMVTGKVDCYGSPYYEYVAQRDEAALDAAMQMYFFLCMIYHEYYGEDNG